MDKCVKIKKNSMTIQVPEENMNEFLYNLEYGKLFLNINQNLEGIKEMSNKFDSRKLNICIVNYT